MKFVMAGAGGVGGYLGVRLAGAGHEVAYLARGRHLAVLREAGITLRSSHGDTVLGPQKASDDPAALGAADVVVVTVKLYDLAALAPRLKPLVGPGTLVLPLQNGVDAHPMLSSALPASNLLMGTVSIKSNLAAPGEIVCKSPFCRVRFGPAQAGTDALAAALNACVGVEAVVTRDIELDVWRKFVMLASFSAVSCLARATIGQVLDSAEACKLLLEAANEAAAVARAHGVALPPDIDALVFDQVRDMPRNARPSMLEDLEAGRPLEVAFLSGAVVRLGAERGVATPMHTVAYRALAMHRNGTEALRAGPDIGGRGK